MKTIRKPFDLEKTLSGKEKVVTHSGEQVFELRKSEKINKSEPYVLSGVVNGVYKTWTFLGRYQSVSENKLDLFIKEPYTLSPEVMEFIEFFQSKQSKPLNFAEIVEMFIEYKATQDESREI